MNDLDSIPCAGGRLTRVEDRVRRYCGLPWSGGPPETWAFSYFDRVMQSDPDWVDPVDVVACAALHPGLSRRDLAWFAESARDFNYWLHELPHGVDLADASPDTVSSVMSLVLFARPVSLSLLSKVAHRKRPRLVPMFDRTIAERYWPCTQVRGERAWPALVQEIRADLRDPETRALTSRLDESLRPDLLDRTPSSLRMLDIAVWMAGFDEPSSTQASMPEPVL